MLSGWTWHQPEQRFYCNFFAVNQTYFIINPRDTSLKLKKPLKETGPSGIEAKVKKYAKKKGCYVRKFNSTNQTGVPDDLFITPSGNTVYIEFKSPGKKPTHAQERELNHIMDQNAPAFVCDNLHEKGVDLWQNDFHHSLEIWHDGYKLIDMIMVVY